VRALSLARFVFALGVTALTACTIWAAIDNPYKTDRASSDGATELLVDGSADAGEEASANRAIDVGFVPNAIGSYGATIYAVDDMAQVHVAYDASTTFTNFWAGDAGGVFLIQRNGVAANAVGVFWTVSSGVHYCGVDAGNCGLLPSTNARAIAASDSVVAWIDDTGVRVCTIPIDACTPATLGASRSAARLAAGPNAAVAWIDGGTAIHFASGLASDTIDLFPYEVDVIATDATSGALYWEGPTAVGFLQFDGGNNAVSDLYSNTKPTALFADRGMVYWSLATTGVVQHCRLDLDAGCSPRDLAATGLRTPQTTHDILATSRKVLALVSSGTSLFSPTLVEWPTPP
jgi:hypothetical protein